jgi:hypothetical protein
VHGFIKIYIKRLHRFYFFYFLFTFFLKKSNNPPAGGQDERPTPIFYRSKSLRNATYKITVRSLSPFAAAPLPMYDRLIKMHYNLSFLNATF